VITTEVDAGAAAPKVGPPDYGSPMSTNPTALAEYRRAIQAARDAANVSVVQSALEAAHEADPDFAAAYLREVLVAEWVDDLQRELFTKAQRLRGRLGPHDRALLDAIEPWFRVPHDADELRRRFKALAVEPDADIALQRCFFLLNVGAPTEAYDACRDAERLDPTLAAAYLGEGLSLAKVGGAAAEEKAYDACIARSPEGSRCVRALAELVAARGRCDEYAALAQRFAVIAPEDADASWINSLAIYAQSARTGRPMDAYALALDSYVKRLDARTGREQRISGDAARAVAEGRLEDAARAYEELGSLRIDEDFRGGAFHAQIELLVEMGRTRAAETHARTWLAQRPSWVPSVQEDSRIFALDALYLAGAMPRERFAAERDAWLRDEEKRGASLDGFLRWSDAYGKAIATPADAREALDSMPRFGPFPERRRNLDVDAALGLALLRAGRPAEAIEPLVAAAESCPRVQHPSLQIASLAWLGEAREATGDTVGACAAYRHVLDAWGRSSISTTARAARAARGRLVCRD
jgi:tetratricopeptide (TPR) repeat protein